MWQTSYLLFTKLHVLVGYACLGPSPAIICQATTVPTSTSIRRPLTRPLLKHTVSSILLTHCCFNHFSDPLTRDVGKMKPCESAGCLITLFTALVICPLKGEWNPEQNNFSGVIDTSNIYIHVYLTRNYLRPFFNKSNDNALEKYRRHFKQKKSWWQKIPNYFLNIIWSLLWVASGTPRASLYNVMLLPRWI